MPVSRQGTKLKKPPPGPPHDGSPERTCWRSLRGSCVGRYIDRSKNLPLPIEASKQLVWAHCCVIWGLIFVALCSFINSWHPALKAWQLVVLVVRYQWRKINACFGAAIQLHSECPYLTTHPPPLSNQVGVCLCMMLWSGRSTRGRSLDRPSHKRPHTFTPSWPTRPKLGAGILQ